MVGRKRRASPPREPHPEPRMEARLQRIVALRESAARKEALSRQYAAEIGNLSAAYRNEARSGNLGRAAALETRLKDLQQETRHLEGEIGTIHDQIAERTAELSDTDLSYL